MKKYSFLFAMVMVLILKAQIPIAKFLSSIDPAVPTGNSVLFSNQSTGNSLSYLWDFGNGTTSTLQDPPAVAYATTGSYLVKLTVTDTSTAKSSTVTNAILVGNSNTIDLSTGKTDTGALLPFLDDGKGGASVDELHWKFLYADGSTTTEKTRHYYTGWSYPTGPPVNNGGLPNSTWIYCPGCTDGTEFYNHISPTFNIPESATDAKLWLKALSFVRNWVYLVKINDDGSNTENLIAATSWRSDGAKGWLNSRNPLVDGMALSPGKYFVKVKVYSNNSQVSESLAVNAVANYGAGVGTVPSVSFGMVGDAPVCTKSSVIFRTITDGAPIGYDWTFTSGNNIVKATGAMPSVTFSTPGVYTAELRTIFSNGLSSSFSIPNYVLVKDCDFSRAPNSYILDVNEPHSGLYIPVRKAYDAWKNSEFLKKQEASDPIPEGKQSASVYWEDVPGLIQDVWIEPKGEPDQSKIKVSVDKTKGKGNAVIAFKVNDKIYWSWHIWVTDDPSNGVTYTQGFETNIEGKEFRPQYMDRNLGATSSSFLGNDWHKSGGLMYQWGRKDPFPPLVYKDNSFYEISGEVGYVRHSNAINQKNASVIKMITRGPGEDLFTGTDLINDNIKYSINNPLNYIVHKEAAATWFSNQQYKVYNTDFTLIETWDLWGDNRKGKYNNASSDDAETRTDSRSYELKSVFDPCPNGWRVPSHYGNTALNNNLNPYGRKESGENDDGTVNSTFTPDTVNENLSGIKVYPSLGMDFRNSSTRNIGIMPSSGNYEYNHDNQKSVFQDNGADGALLQATYGAVANGIGGYRSFGMINDPHQRDTSVGRNAFYINQLGSTRDGSAVRCIRDPNASIAGYNYPTEYISGGSVGADKDWAKDPNSFVVMTNTDKSDDLILDIKLRKAYAMQRLYGLGDSQSLSGSIKTPSVQWTTNKDLITNIQIIDDNGDANPILRVTLNPNQKGNALVAFHLGNNGVWGSSNPDRILWSWHIWAPNTGIGQVDYVTESLANGGQIPVANESFVNPTKSGGFPLATTFMDRNLGALYSFPNTDGMGGTAITNDTRIQNSGGLHYQWGRKDPIPTFWTPGAVVSVPVYRQISHTGNIIGYGAAITDDIYTNTYSKEYEVYSKLSGVTPTDTKQKKIRKIIKYSVENPFTFMYHNRSGDELEIGDAGNFKAKSLQVKDWISPAGEVGYAPERWGHASEKSPFDPCPEGWRVPDTSFTNFVNGYDKGTSPWFYNNYKVNNTYSGYGFPQSTFFALVGSKANNTNTTLKYPGRVVTKFTYPATRVGWEFDFTGSLFNIGNIPNTGIRGRLGGNDWYDRFDTTAKNHKLRTGLWTSALADFYTGYALSMEMTVHNLSVGALSTGAGNYPQAGMGVRCAKDAPRYTGVINITNKNSVAAKEEIGLFKPQPVPNDLLVYPNPVTDELSVNKDNISYKIYSMSGTLISSGVFENRKINISGLPNGEYIIQLYNENNETTAKKMIKK